MATLSRRNLVDDDTAEAPLADCVLGVHDVSVSIESLQLVLHREDDAKKSGSARKRRDAVYNALFSSTATGLPFDGAPKFNLDTRRRLRIRVRCTMVQ